MQKRNKTGFVYQYGDEPLTDVEAEYLHLLTVERLTLKEASIRRGCTTQNSRRYVKRLINKGVMDKHFNRLDGETPRGGEGETFKSENTENGLVWRLHRVHISVKILDGHLSKKYKGLVGSQVEVRGSTVLFHRSSVEVYLGGSFVHERPDGALRLAARRVFSLLRVLERDFVLLLVKSRAQNVRWVGAEFARGNDVLASRPGSARLCVVDRDDGTRRVVVDFSLGSVPELEFVHKRSSFDDSRVYHRLVEDIVHNDHLLPSVLSKAVINNAEQLGEVVSLLKSTAAVQKSIIDLLKAQLPDSSSSFDEGEERGFPDYVG